MALVDIAADLAALHYAARLLPDPTLDPDPAPEALVAYHDTGTRLAASLLRPQRRAVIRCDIPPRPGQRPRALAAVHDRYLLVAQNRRGPNAFGMRLVTHNLVDLRMAQREGHRDLTLFCHLGDRHRLSLRWLRSARTYEVSDRVERFTWTPAGIHDADGNDVPIDEDSIWHQAFVTTTGPLDGSTLLMTLPLYRAIFYRIRFGAEAPHGAHFDRITCARDFRGEPADRSILRSSWSLSDEETAMMRRVEQAHR